MQHCLRTTLAAVLSVITLTAGNSQASRLAVVALPSTHGDAPIEQADVLTAHLLARKHRTIASANAAERLLSGNMGAGADWAANVMNLVRQGRDALTRLDRRAADQARREVSEAIERGGGGAGGAEVLVEWALFESAMAGSSGYSPLAEQWTARAAALGPSVVLDPLVHPNAERDAFQAAVEALVREDSGSFEVVSVPPSADVWVDGVHRCRTPCSTRLLPGLHFARITSPAHTPAVLTLQTKAGASVARRVGLTSAYTGASLGAIEAMLDDPSRVTEAQSSLAAVAEFLDVDHVVVLRRGPNASYSLRIAPAVEGNESHRSGLTAAALPASADAMLTPSPSVAPEPEDDAWYESTGLWIGVASVAVVAVGAGLLLRGEDPSQPSQGTLVIGGR